MRRHDCVLLGLILVERLSLCETALTLGITTRQVCRDYDAALARLRRSLAPVVARSRASKPAPRPASAALASIRKAS